MGLITKFGTAWGAVPQTSGNLYWVGPAASYSIEGRTYSASNDNDGLSPERAVLSLDYAVGLTTANAGDVIVLLPGAHTMTATVAADVAGITITGIPGNMSLGRSRKNSGGKRQRTTLTSTETAGICITVSAADVEIAHIGFLPPAAGGRGVSISGTGDRCYIHDCTFSLIATASVTTYGVTRPDSLTDPLEDLIVSNCYFVSGTAAASGANGSAVNALGTVHGMLIENSTFELKGTAAWANAILSSHAGSLGLVVRDCDFINPTSVTTVITSAINTTGQTTDGSTQVHRCYIPAGTDGVTSTATVDIVLCETYLASNAGGALVTSA